MQQYPTDGWLKIVGLGDGAVFIHPTFGQFKSEYVQKILCDKLEKAGDYGLYEDKGKDEPVASVRKLKLDQTGLYDLHYITWLEQTMREGIAQMYENTINELVNFDPSTSLQKQPVEDDQVVSGLKQ